MATSARHWKAFRTVFLFSSLCYCNCTLIQFCKAFNNNDNNYLEKIKILSEKQFGFCARHLAEQQLLHTIHNLTLNNKTKTDVILLDFCKVFDKVSHCLLLIIMVLETQPLNEYPHS